MEQVPKEWLQGLWKFVLYCYLMNCLSSVMILIKYINDFHLYFCHIYIFFALKKTTTTTKHIFFFSFFFSSHFSSFLISTRSWIEKNYPTFKKLNPKLPILVREAPNADSIVYAQYGYFLNFFCFVF